MSPKISKEKGDDLRTAVTSAGVAAWHAKSSSSFLSLQGFKVSEHGQKRPVLARSFQPHLLRHVEESLLTCPWWTRCTRKTDAQHLSSCVLGPQQAGPPADRSRRSGAAPVNCALCITAVPSSCMAVLRCILLRLLRGKHVSVCTGGAREGSKQGAFAQKRRCSLLTRSALAAAAPG